MKFYVSLREFAPSSSGRWVFSREQKSSPAISSSSGNEEHPTPADRVMTIIAIPSETGERNGRGFDARAARGTEAPCPKCFSAANPNARPLFRGLNDSSS